MWITKSLLLPNIYRSHHKLLPDHYLPVSTCCEVTYSKNFVYGIRYGEDMQRMSREELEQGKKWLNDSFYLIRYVYLSLARPGSEHIKPAWWQTILGDWIWLKNWCRVAESYIKMVLYEMKCKKFRLPWACINY